MVEKKCAVCKNKILGEMNSLKWDAELRKCYSEFHNDTVCRGCFRTLEKSSRIRFFKNLTGRQNDRQYKPGFYKEKDWLTDPNNKEFTDVE